MPGRGGRRPAVVAALLVAALAGCTGGGAVDPDPVEPVPDGDVFELVALPPPGDDLVAVMFGEFRARLAEAGVRTCGCTSPPSVETLAARHAVVLRGKVLGAEPVTGPGVVAIALRVDVSADHVRPSRAPSRLPADRVDVSLTVWRGAPSDIEDAGRVVQHLLPFTPIGATVLVLVPATTRDAGGRYPVGLLLGAHDPAEPVVVLDGEPALDRVVRGMTPGVLIDAVDAAWAAES